MIVLAVGVVMLSALHVAAAVPSLKTGQRRYGAVFGIISLAAIFMVIGWRHAAFVPVYEPPGWGRHANFVLNLMAFFSFGIFLFRGKLRQRLRFPMGLAVILWATGHLLANGDLAGLILFGGLLLHAVVYIAIAAAKGIYPSAERRDGHDLLSLLAGAALYGVMTQLHPVITGVPILTLTR